MARIEKRTTSFIKPRGWGHEVWIENIDEYCGKLLVIDAGKRGSLHFHMNKKETMWVKSGELHLILIDPDEGKEYVEVLRPEESILIPPGQVHQIVNPSSERALELIEFSTTHFETDSHRIRKGD